MLYSSTSADQHLLLETGTPKFICIENWPIQESGPTPEGWYPWEYSPTLFRCTSGMYTLWSEFYCFEFWHQRNRRILKVFFYFLRSTTNPFLLWLTDQCRIGFFIFIRGKHSSTLLLTSFDAIFHWWSLLTSDFVSNHCIIAPERRWTGNTSPPGIHLTPMFLT